MRNRIRIVKDTKPELVGQATPNQFKATLNTAKAQYKSMMRKRRQSPFTNG